VKHRHTWATLAIALTVQSITQGAEGRHLAFVSCPVVRDTRTVPCWLSDYGGETYYLGIQTDVSAPFNPPSLGHRILVEGEVSDEPAICGGKVLKAVTVSILEGRAEQCNTVLPSDDRYQLPFEPPRPPGPSKGRLAFDYGPPPAAPKPPFKERSFTITYDFDGTVGFKHPRMLTPILDYATLSRAKRIHITGYRAATALTDGTTLTESDAIAERRARQVEQLLRGAGVTQPAYQVDWDAKTHAGGPDERKVTVTVYPD
jgi:hypothetical protein